MKAKLLVIANLLFISLLFSACKKDKDNTKQKEPTIYAAGDLENSNSTSSATFWKNGVATSLPSTSNATVNSIVVVGDDVYTAGFEQNSGINKVKVWKNKTDLYTIPNATATSSAEANAIYVNAGGVHIAGVEYVTPTLNDKSFARYWRNGTMVNIPIIANGYSYANSFSLSNNILYIGGGDTKTSPSPNSYLMSHWNTKTNTRIDDASAKERYVRKTIVVGGDVYHGGYYMNAGSPPIAAIWKNGILTNLSDGTYEETVTDFVINGSDMYACIQQRNPANPSTFIAKLWKNGVVQKLSDGLGNARPTCITVNGSDVYVGGRERMAPGDSRATIWKNGVAQYLTDGTYSAEIKSIFIQP